MAETFEESFDGPYYLETMSIPDDSDDGFEYNEISIDENIVHEREEDFHKPSEGSQAPQQEAASPAEQRSNTVPEVMDDFLRNFLVKMGMVRTLDCFQTEWFEMLQKGTLKIDLVGFVPDIYIHNQLLENQLKNVQRERDSYKQSAFQTEETIVKLEKERDFHRLQHKRVVQEKNRLIEDVQRLKKHCVTYEPALKELNEKYQTASRQKMLVSIERDRIIGQISNSQNTHSSQATHRSLKESGKQKFQHSPESGRPTRQSPDEVARCDSTKTKNTSKHPKDSVFPATRSNPFLPQIKALSALSSKTSGFSITKSIKAHTMPISFLALHPRKLVVASASDDHFWRLWGMPEGEMIMTGEGHTDWLSSCSFHPNGGCLATTSGDTTVKIWDFAKARCVLTLEGHTHATWGCTFHSCGDFVASCSMDNTAKVWDLNSERCRYTLRGHVDSVNSINFLPFSNILLTCSADKTVSLWDARTGLCAQTFYGHERSCNSATFNALGEIIASCDSYGVVKLWDVRNLSAMATFDTGPYSSNQVVFSPNGQMLAVASDDAYVKLVELSSSFVSTLLGHDDAVQSVVFDHKGDLISAGCDGEIFIWS